MLGTLADLATRVGGRVAGDGSTRIERIASVDDAIAGALTFATDERYLAAALASAASAVLIDEALAPADPSKPLLLVPSARVALASLLQMLRPPRPTAGRHPTAVVETGAKVADDAHLGAHTYVGRDSVIGARVVLEAGAYVGARVSIGADSWLRPQTRVMDDCILGARVALFPGATIGSEGFGWAFVDGRLERIPQVGNVVLGDDVEIGANTCVDRAQTGSTSIGEGTKIDNLVQIGHNCKLGKHDAIAALSGLAGTTTIGDYTRVAGMVGFKGHITVGSRVTIAGDSRVWGDIPDGIMISGAPASEHRERLRKEVTLRNLPKLIARVEALERVAKKSE
ncbi:MAG: UDP-3-O-(3-hydroxymyristoyl)glucosamine N-acyltransferase [Candidatus Eremiobacteraeota bacterium]|nr:UDP-3-O-(3-hydroxymyristoyl)glucosamine N-acyltransferase [Candidatus Eremiobacteraeota bacterium]